MQSHWITHKGKRIFVVDLSGLGFDMAAVRAEFDAVRATLTGEPPGSVLLFTDSRNIKLSPEVVALLKNALTVGAPHVRKQAVAGITGVRRGMVDILNKFAGPVVIQPFAEQAEALDWLAQQ